MLYSSFAVQPTLRMTMDLYSSYSFGPRTYRIVLGCHSREPRVTIACSTTSAAPDIELLDDRRPRHATLVPPLRLPNADVELGGLRQPSQIIRTWLISQRRILATQLPNAAQSLSNPKLTAEFLSPSREN